MELLSDSPKSINMKTPLLFLRTFWYLMSKCVNLLLCIKSICFDKLTNPKIFYLLEIPYELMGLKRGKSM